MPTGIYKHTEDHNHKISDALRIVWKNPTHRKKISEALKGKIKSKDTIKKLSDAAKGKKHSSETLQKMSESSKKRWEKPEERMKISVGNKGKIISEEQRKKLSIANKGKTMSEEQRKLLSKINTGKHLSEETKRKLSAYHTGKSPSETTRKKLSDAIRGDKCYLWKGGISFEPYCVKFSREFKERVRAFFGYCCVECGVPQNGRKLHVHHVNFNKMSCCDNTLPLFATLCMSCHMKTNFNREYWQQHFTDMINNHYGGKCYFTTDEMMIYQTVVKNGK